MDSTTGSCAVRRPERSCPVDCAPGLCGRAQRTARSPFYQSRAIGTTRPRGLPQETCHRCGEPEGLAEGYRFYEGIEQWVELSGRGRQDVAVARTERWTETAAQDSKRQRRSPEGILDSTLSTGARDPGSSPIAEDLCRAWPWTSTLLRESQHTL